LYNRVDVLRRYLGIEVLCEKQDDLKKVERPLVFCCAITTQAIDKCQWNGKTPTKKA
jgi:hypothetical protein